MDKIRPISEEDKIKQQGTAAIKPVSSGSIDPADEAYRRDLAVEEKEDELLQFISFVADKEEYALGIGEITEAVKMKEITEVPNAPFFIAGIISLRGEIIPVMSLQKRLGLKESDISQDTRIVITSFEDMKMGLIVDSIRGVLRVHPAEIETTPPIQGEAAVEFIKGVVHNKGRLIMLLSLSLLFEKDLVQGES